VSLSVTISVKIPLELVDVPLLVLFTFTFTPVKLVSEVESTTMPLISFCPTDAVAMQQRKNIKRYLRSNIPNRSAKTSFKMGVETKRFHH
jgi:hypothetical protein